MDPPVSVHLFTYRYQGASWILKIKASSAEDAIARVRQLTTAVYDGEQILEVWVGSHRLAALLKKWFAWASR